MATDLENLRTMELHPNDLNNLSPQERQKKIRKQWLKLALKYHPDKNTASHEIYDRIDTAYKELCNGSQDEGQYNETINSYFTRIDIAIPETAFDLLLQEEIENNYSALRRELNSLETEDEKRKLASEHASFISLAQSLEQQKDRLNQQRAHYLFEQENAPLYSKLALELRHLTITLFAEEYLDDFQYRHALATGVLSPIFATRKLFSPFKWLAAIINGAIIILSSTSYHFFFH